jgi:hypothetical protein
MPDHPVTTFSTASRARLRHADARARPAQNGSSDDAAMCRRGMRGECEGDRLVLSGE